MKRQFKGLLAIVILVLVATAIFPLPVMAAPVVGTVSPALVVNDIENVITITGSGFDATSIVTIGLNATVSSSFDSGSGNLLATIPVGFQVGIYNVTVTNGDNSTFTKNSALTVVEPAATSAPTAVPPTAMPTAIPTAVPPTATTTLNPFSRPQIMINTYSLSVGSVRYGQDFVLNMSLDNAGSSTAYGIKVTFTSTDLLMLKNGGVVVAGDLGVIGKANFGQAMTAASSLSGESRISVEMDVSYYDVLGVAYSDKFTLIFPVASTGSGSNLPASSATPTGIHRPQLVVTAYQTDADPLQPGVTFTLNMTVKNAGNVPAKGITMIIGGGSSGSASGTPSGGVSGGSGEFTNFAPVGSSNIQSLGDLQPGASLPAIQKLVVNVSTTPGAYPMKITFSYQDNLGNPVNDDQVITLLVYNLPTLDVSFYQPVGTLTAGQPNTLPLQVISLGKRNVVLGKMKVEASAGDVVNGEGLVGSLDPGAYFTLDAQVMPYGPGSLDLNITIEYTDDFNQVRSITKTLTVDVAEMSMEPTPDMSAPGGKSQVSSGPESFWQKLWRFLLGLFGLDSGSAVSTPAPLEPTQIQIPIIHPGGGKG